MKEINCALQGGGSHGAFTWGVLDRLLEEERIDIRGISATSSGAVNAVLMAYGLEVGGRAKASELLRTFWAKLSEFWRMTVFQPTPLDKMVSAGDMTMNPFVNFFRFYTFVLSPYQWNPLNLDPVTGILEELVDFKVLNGQERVKLFLSATNVKSGRVRIFTQPELSLKTVMASACLPIVFQAVEIEGEYYWDGGFVCDPALFPLHESTPCRDILVVQIKPIATDRLPLTIDDIIDRAFTISFNASYLRELNALFDKVVNGEDAATCALIHVIETGKEMNDLGYTSRFNVDMDFLLSLYGQGRAKADEWITKNYSKLGKESTFDMKELFL